MGCKGSSDKNVKKPRKTISKERFLGWQDMISFHEDKFTKYYQIGKILGNVNESNQSSYNLSIRKCVSKTTGDYKIV